MYVLKNNEGYFQCGMPYNRFGCGERILVIFQGLMFENKPMSGFMAKNFGKMYDSLEQDYTIYIVNRKPGLAEGCSMKDISDDYAQMVKEEFGGPVDVLGISTGGSVVQYFAADHPELVRRLVIHSSAHALSESAKAGQLKVAKFARKGKWAAAYATFMSLMLPNGAVRYILMPFVYLMSLIALVFVKPDNSSDLVNTIEAEDQHDFGQRLHEIKVPTLIIAGAKDPFYTEQLFRETAEGIPDARLILYKKMGHPATGKQFKIDLSAFLLEG